jgi:mono/diheme cytochrome c family protein
MADQPSSRPLQESRLFPDGASARPLVPGTVPFAGQSGEGREIRFPQEGETIRVTLDMLRQGRQRYEIYCAPCHGRTGEGDGMIVQRGFPAPPSYFSPRLLSARDGHIYSVITNGFGRMYGYAYRIEPRERAAIVAYIRALQYSRNAAAADVPGGDPDRPRERRGMP